MRTSNIVVVLKEAPAALSQYLSVNDSDPLDIEITGSQLRLRSIFPPTIEQDGAVTDSSTGALSLDERQAMARFCYLENEHSPEEEEQLLSELRNLEFVDTAYSRPNVENPIANRQRMVRRPSRSSRRNINATIPDLRPRQGYLDVAPKGIGVAAAWNLPGGKGSGVEVIDIEGAWTFDHIDLAGNGGLRGAGTEYDDLESRNHGTACMGIVGANEGPTGVTGIAPECTVSAISDNHPGRVPGAIFEAASLLGPGDIILLELHLPGPRFQYHPRPQDTKGYIPVEWFQDIFLAIRFAVGKGIIVVEPAGNGDEDLDNRIYDTPHPSFVPSIWKNPFRLEAFSGAILVGAGAPPSGNFGADRSRLPFSNFGTRLDCQGWGEEVTTTGYGNFAPGEAEGKPESQWFTDSFNGTSSAAPMIAGVLACLQGVAKSAGGLLTPDMARRLLRRTGSPQNSRLDAPLSQRIGNRPDLASLLDEL